MTNGEMIQKVFKGCEVCEPIPEEDIIHVIFPDKNDSAIGFDWSWWNMEHEEPTAKNNLGVDCISRSDALALYCDKCGLYNCISKCASYRAVEKMPPVTPQTRKGHWIDTNDNAFVHFRVYKCSHCGATFCDYPKNIKKHKYCFDCGTKMVEPQESEDT